jgi:hypothetical protein
VVVPVIYCWLDDLAQWATRRRRVPIGDDQPGVIPAK